MSIKIRCDFKTGIFTINDKPVTRDEVAEIFNDAHYALGIGKQHAQYQAQKERQAKRQAKQENTK